MKFRQVRFILGFLVLLLTFQNCGGSGTQVASKDNATTDSSNSPQGAKTPTSSGSGTSGVNSGNARGIAKAPGSSGSSSFGGISSGSAGSTSGGSAGGGTGGSTCLGCTTGGGNTGTIGSGSTAFRISKQPISKTVSEMDLFSVGVTIEGGTSPYTFKWFRNSEEIPLQYGYPYYENYEDRMDRIYKEGEYYVKIIDGKGVTLTSNKVMIRMNAKICPAGRYYTNMPTSPAWMSYLSDLFQYKSTRYFITAANPTLQEIQFGSFAGNWRALSYLQIGFFDVGNDMSNNQNVVVACSTDVPNIHTSQCASNAPQKCYGYGDSSNGNQTYTGGINFTCRNGYLEFKSNTCSLTATPAGTTPGEQGPGVQ